MTNATPQIKFFRNRHAQSVAYAVHGQGPALILPAWWVSHLELDWQTLSYQRFFLQLGEYFTVVRYDRPGAGLSGRERRGFTLADEVETLSDLIDHLSITSCTLLGVSCGGPVSILYARNKPEKVNKLVFFGAYARGSDICDPELQEVLCSLVLSYWGLGAKLILDLFDPDMDPKVRKQLTGVHKKSASPQMAADLLRLSFSMDACEAAGQLNIPSLVIHRASDRTVPFNVGCTLASTLPDAQLFSVSGSAHLPWLGAGFEDIVKNITHFVGAQIHSISLTPTTHNQFRRVGDIWTLSYAGKMVHVKDSRGLQDIALLIGSKHGEIHVADLIGTLQPIPIETESELLDEAAINAYRQRLEVIIEEKQSAGAGGDEQRYATLEKEEDDIFLILKQGIGLGGRRRQFNNNTEKARKAVAARIRVAIKKIKASHPELSQHLNDSLHTGNYCSYTPLIDIKWLS